MDKVVTLASGMISNLFQVLYLLDQKPWHLKYETPYLIEAAIRDVITT